ncbi:hypothetical protein GUJ93_ZPchr0005g15183 [Zizania palustris]|uniref:Uncharacterized protein n=1 Tax=Zizania palustris TaxID=103762 RepID=A0A8J5VQL0_ZIZPA|nr:hypothetical protein GUJ93_ZPchr0005g15183 [Zizania palustris]
MDSGALGDNNKDAGDQSLDWIIVETEEEMKCQDTLVDYHTVAEDAILKYDFNETSTTADSLIGPMALKVQFPVEWRRGTLKL